MEFITNVLAFIGALFVFGTVWLWVLGALFFGLMVFMTEEVESHFWSSVFLVLFIWVVTYANGISIIQVGPSVWAMWIGVYLGVGVLWSTVKWFSYVLKQKERYKELKGRYEGIKTPFITYLQEHSYNPNRIVSRGNGVTIEEFAIPTVSGRFGDLVRWVVWWPFSAFWTLFNDFLRRVGELIVRVFRKMYTKIATVVFGEV